VDGTLAIHSEPGRGTEVRVRVPQAVPSAYLQPS
jgi:signal transduction histidine kinase